MHPHRNQYFRHQGGDVNKLRHPETPGIASKSKKSFSISFDHEHWNWRLQDNLFRYASQQEFFNSSSAPAAYHNQICFHLPGGFENLLARISLEHDLAAGNIQYPGQVLCKLSCLPPLFFHQLGYLFFQTRQHGISRKMRKSRDIYDIDRSNAPPATMCDINSNFHRLLAHIRSIGCYHNFFYHITTEFIALQLSYSWSQSSIPIWLNPASINKSSP